MSAAVGIEADVGAGSAAMRRAGAGPTVAVEDLACWFDLSPPWIERALTGRPRLSLKAVDGVDFAIARGETFSVVGESGCGKSTLARLILGLHRPTRGAVRFAAGAGRDGFVRAQMIFQDPYASLNPRWRVADIVAEPVRHLGLREGGPAIARRVDQLLETVGLSPRDRDRYPHEFSGGQRQRVSIARALAAEPEFLVCDEPTSALDVSVQAQILNLLGGLKRDLGLTLLFISHNLAVVRHVSDRLAVMYLGRIVEEGPSEAVFAQPRHPYTRFLLDSIPDIARPDRDRAPSATEPPSPLAPPPGCAFHPRCPLATARCAAEAPAARQVGGALVRCHHAEAS
jgi:peptide/nickel transport system ATP-binding protein